MFQGFAKRREIIAMGRCELWPKAVQAACAILVVCVQGIGDAIASEPSERVARGLLALYTFEDASGGVIADRSGVGEPLNLRIDKPQGTQTRNGRLSITAPVIIASDGPATKIVAAVQQSQEVSVEAWLRPLSVQQSGPARIVSLSIDTSRRNLTFGQDKSRFDFRLRAKGTDDNGLPSTATKEESASAKLTHILFALTSDGVARIDIDGREAARRKLEPAFDRWQADYRLLLANELSGDRPWLGDLHLVAIYNSALTPEESRQNYGAGVPAAENYASEKLPPAHGDPVDFVKHIRPILREHCYECHAGTEEDGGLNLGIRRRALQGGDNGPVFVARDSANSRLIHLVAAIDKSSVMPPDSEGLSTAEIGLLRAWIDQGAHWPEGFDVVDPREVEAKSHWAFQPLRQVEEPPVQDRTGPKTSIDRFILAKLEAAGLQPQKPAQPRQLLRRFSFDLLGLPPSPEELEAFCREAAKDSDEAISAALDRLLASTHYGERWGRHWLDVARYADSDGQESDRDRPNAYHYRDFVIRAFNSDLPYDQFVQWQLAGDEYDPDNPEAVAATGFLAAGPFAALPDRLMEDERLRNRYNELDDIISTIGTGLLGLTLGCVRCHDHKYDAIPARDYYSLLSAFHGGRSEEVVVGASQQKIFAFRDASAEPSPTWLFQRANYYDRDQPVSLGFVSILTNGKAPEAYWQLAREQSRSTKSTAQRRALAEWMTDTEHGAGALLARVIVNRIWQHHFGQGLVRTVGDFGVRADPPTHPELLEWLAYDLVSNGWRIKRLQRQILESKVYQQASSGQPPSVDPDNRWLWKMPLQRLEGEILRDSMLAVSGSLNPQALGPAVKPPIAAEAILARNLKDPYPSKIQEGPELHRRSVYLFHKRVVPYPLLQAFDKPDAQQSCSRRDRTTVAPQALALMNDPFVRQRAFDFAERLIKEQGIDTAKCIQHGYLLAVGRLPNDDERRSAETFVDSQCAQRRSADATIDEGQARKQAMADFCQVLFSLNEFIYID